MSDKFTQIECQCYGGPCDGRIVQISKGAARIFFPIDGNLVAEYKLDIKLDGNYGLRYVEIRKKWR